MTRFALIVCLFAAGCGSESADRHDQAAQRMDQRQNAIEQARTDASGKPATD
jgi:hypothetical protein